MFMPPLLPERPEGDFAMTLSIGRPFPDTSARAREARDRRAAALSLAAGHGCALTRPNGEETAYGATFALSYHKGLPHDADGFVHAPSHAAMVRALTGHEDGAVETLPLGANRQPGSSPEAPPRHTTAPGEDPAQPLGYRRLTSPLTGHVYEVQGADAAAFTIAPAPLLASDELAAEMAELYVMALCRDAPFTEIAAGTAPANLGALFSALAGMPWLNGSHVPQTAAEARRLAARGVLGSTGDLFRGSTPGAKAGHWMSQFLLVGNDNTRFEFLQPNGTAASPGPAGPDFRGTFAEFRANDGFILYGTQIIDQRSIVAREGVDYMTDWASWLDCQNGVDFNNLDLFRNRRRYLTTPRDIATYVHYDALYQAYLNACLIMLADPAFSKDRGLPETASRTRAAFASFGGPHILSLVTEVATRGLKAVWRQKWLHHRRARPEVVAAMLTLHANDPGRISDPALAAALTALRARIPQVILDAVAAHNAAQNAASRFTPVAPPDPGLPVIDPARNYLLPMAFPEGSPTHPAYGAGHATVAGACVTMLKAFFEMTDPDGSPRPWPHTPLVPRLKETEGGELIPDPAAPALTIAGELDKLAANIAIARNIAGVHYYTDYFESLRLGERIAVSVIADQMGMYGEPVSVAFTSFDGDSMRLTGTGGGTHLAVTGAGGAPVTAADWYGRYGT